jgi:hypothetical protein
MAVKNSESGYQALAQLRGRVPELLEPHRLGEEVLIEKYLKPLLEAEETKFFKDGKVKINVKALAIRHPSSAPHSSCMDPTRREILKRQRSMVCA